MSRRQTTSNSQTTANLPPVPDVSKKSLWVSRAYVSRALGISYAMVPKVAHASEIRLKRLPGMCGIRFYLPDIDNLAMKAIINPPEPIKRTARKTG
jgi:hypothetical protein